MRYTLQTELNKYQLLVVSKFCYTLYTKNNELVMQCYDNLRDAIIDIIWNERHQIRVRHYNFGNDNFNFDLDLDLLDGRYSLNHNKNFYYDNIPDAIIDIMGTCPYGF